MRGSPRSGRPRRRHEGDDPEVRLDEQDRERRGGPEVGDEGRRHQPLADDRLVEPGLDEHGVDNGETRRRERNPSDLGRPDGSSRGRSRRRVPRRRTGAKNETTPIDRLARQSRLNCGTSTSAPARNVSTTPANEPMNESQPGIERSNALPTTTPAASSISATERPISTETIDASKNRRREDRRYRQVAHRTLLPGDLPRFGRGHQPWKGG